jgi:K+-transporting ATPase ATPase C chain
MRNSSSVRALWTAARLTLILTLVLGVAYPAVVWGIGRVAFPSQAAGSLIADDTGQVRGSALLGQSFLGADGEPLARYFQPRPSAAGDGYDAAASSGSNLGPEDAGLVAAIRERREQVAAFNGVPVDAVPPDAVTASGSGLDPHISPAYAELQVARVAAARGMTQEEVRALVAEHTSARDLGFLGEPRVDVVTLNLALDER